MPLQDFNRGRTLSHHSGKDPLTLRGGGEKNTREHPVREHHECFCQGFVIDHI